MTLDARIAQLSEADARRLLITLTCPLAEAPARTPTPDARTCAGAHRLLRRPRDHDPAR